MNRIYKMTHNRNFPIIVILLSGLILAFFIFSDFGASEDEPNYYQYADSTLRAYSIADRLDGTFQLDLALGPSDLHDYGPAFLLLGESVHALLARIFPQYLSIDLWHLTVYLSYLLGVFFFYKLAQRWVDTTAAAISTLLFASQPVLFGNAWINPKDIPLMVFFMGAIYLGFIFNDHAKIVFRDRFQENKIKDILPHKERGVTTKWKKVVYTFNLLLCTISLIFVLGYSAIRKIITNTILSVNINSPAGLIDKIFLKVAHNAHYPLNNYVNKAITIFNHFLAGFIAITIVSIIVTICIRYSQILIKQIHSFKNFVYEIKKNYADYPQKKAFIISFIGACVFLGFACATRIVGPFAAVLVVWIWVINLKIKSIPLIVVYGALSFVIFIFCWPYLWQNTWGNLMQVVQRMTNNQSEIDVLFGGKFYDSRALPVSYLPTLLLKTLTEPAIVLIMMGLAVIVTRFIKKEIRRSEILVPLAWFFVPFFYVLITTPPMYDNYRHFLFIIPAAFLFTAFLIDWLFKKIRNRWLNAVLALIILVPGFVANVQLHPYEYAYYNSFAGGIQGAAHMYEIDYWLTCYKDLTQQINANEKGQVNVYVDEEDKLVRIYANGNFVVNDTSNMSYQLGNLIILPLRWEHESLFRNYPIIYSVKLDGVDLCVAKRMQ